MKKIEMKNDINNDCVNCAHSVQHYGNLKGKFYRMTGCVHCSNPNMKLTERKKSIDNIIKCEHWLPKQIEIQERREIIIETLCKMAEQIDGIAQILEEDNKK